MPTAAQLIYGHPKQTRNLNVNKNTISKLNYGIFEGRQEKSIERCIDLLVHTTSCRNVGFCKEGDGCCRTKQVLVHNRNCLNVNGECSICLQFVALCHLHGQRCQARVRSCSVPHCRNGKLQPLIELDMNKQNKGLFSKLAKKSFQVVKKGEHVKNEEKALRTPSLMKRKQNTLRMFKDPRMNELLKELYEMKKSKIEFQTKTGEQIDQLVPLVPTFANDDINVIKPAETDPISWFANVSFMPI